MANTEALLQVQRLQFSEKPAAEALLLDILVRLFPDLQVADVELRPQVTSLNSFNGYLTTADGRRLFFKTHVEQDSVIDEYYNATLLAEAGYPVVQPLYSSTRDGQQLLVYPIISDPSVFDVARTVERRGEFAGTVAEQLTSLQVQEDRALFQRFINTLTYADSDDHQRAPIHQLFWHRLTGGRFDRFYGSGNQFELPGLVVGSDLVMSRKWVINGRVYKHTLGQLTHDGVDALNPAQFGPSIIGHGDAHNGNVFFAPEGLKYFDPAFAGKHDPLLDLVKPLYHNVHAMWMYFQREEAATLHIELDVSGDTWFVTHDYGVNSLREMFWSSKVVNCLKPMVQLLHSENMLSPHWAQRLRLALMCCPLLTMNLTTFQPEIALLGLAHCIEFGSETLDGTSRVDQLIEGIAADLH